MAQRTFKQMLVTGTADRGNGVYFGLDEMTMTRCSDHQIEIHDNGHIRLHGNLSAFDRSVERFLQLMARSNRNHHDHGSVSRVNSSSWVINRLTPINAIVTPVSGQKSGAFPFEYLLVRFRSVALTDLKGTSDLLHSDSVK